MNDFQGAQQYVDALMDLAADGDFPFWKAFGLGLRAALIARDGRIMEARALSSDAFATLDTLSVCWFRPFIFSTLAESFLHVGEPAAASRYVEMGLLLMEQTGERWIGPELHRLKSEVAPMLERQAQLGG